MLTSNPAAIGEPIALRRVTPVRCIGYQGCLTPVTQPTELVDKRVRVGRVERSRKRIEWCFRECRGKIRTAIQLMLTPPSCESIECRGDAGPAFMHAVVRQPAVPRQHQ